MKINKFKNNNKNTKIQSINSINSLTSIKNIKNITTNTHNIKKILFIILIIIFVSYLIYFIYKKYKNIKSKETFDNEKIIIPDIIGGLGNQIFVIAAAFAYSKDNNYKLMLDNRNVVYSYGRSRHTYNEKIFYKIPIYDIEKKNFVNITENEYASGNNSNENKNANNNIFLTGGYYQEAKYFNKYRNEILNLFEASNDTIDKVNELFKKNNININDDFLVAIHIRLDDVYTPIDADKRVYDKDEYDLIIEKLPEHLKSNPNTKFIIFSNDIPRTKDIFKPAQIDHSRMIYIESEDYIELALMAKCNDYIASPSTFIWWGIYLNKNPDKKIFIYWKQDSDYRKDFYTKYKYMKDNNIVSNIINNNTNVNNIETFSNELVNSVNSVNNIDNINRFHLTDYKYLFFDVFYKDNNIYLILPIYDTLVNKDDIEVKINNNKINVILEHIKDTYEPTHILIYEYKSDLSQIEINITYKDKSNKYTLEHIKSDKNKNELSITTLFKDDYNIFPLFYKYYKKQGVSRFYMYYNGIITPDIKTLFNHDDVTLIQWDYQYFNTNCKNLHHAQPGQMHHAIYRYGKDINNYMIFCDLDEYLYIPEYTLKNFIMSNGDVDVFGFCNRWSKTIDGNIPSNFPTTFLTSEKLPNFDRSKNIYKLNSITTVDIHGYENKYNKVPIITKNFDMFHFYNWSQKDRIMDNCCDILITI